MLKVTIPIAILSMAGAAVAQEPAGSEVPGETTPAGPAPYLASEPEELFEKAIELVARGSILEAKALFKALTEAHPQMPEPYINLAVLLAAEGDTEGSAEAVEAAIMAHPICRAAYELEFQRELGGTSAVVPAESVTPPPPRVVGPADVPAVTASEGADDDLGKTVAITNMVNAWAAAWSSQQVDEYLTFYSEGFRPSGGASREDWETTRRQRLSAPQSIEVELSNVQVDLAAPDKALATFTQSYRSDTFSDVVIKTLDLERVGTAWKIVRERAGG